MDIYPEYNPFDTRTLPSYGHRRSGILQLRSRGYLNFN
jgi:hypothetical protein